jgi:hypothetical protein
VINTLDPGLIIRTLQKIKKRKIEKQLEEQPIIITDFYKRMLINFEPLEIDRR